MSVQIVISGNRVIAHGTGFSVSGNTVENESTGKVYENATIATVESVPDDIDSAGYEYHAGRFVPCAPYGPGDKNGYVMEVCPECATPRNSGIPMSVLKWETLSEVVFSEDIYSTGTSKNYTVQFPISDISEINKDYPDLRLLIKNGSIKNDDATTTLQIEIENDPSWFSDGILPGTQKDYENCVIRRMRKEIYDNAYDFDGSIYIRVYNYSSGDTITLTFELQGRKE